MTAIPVFGAQNTSATTNTSNASWVDVVSYTFEDTDQVASAAYVVFWQGAFGYDIGTTDYQVQVIEGATPRASLNIEQKEITAPADRDQQGGFFFFTAAGTPADTTFKIQIKLETTGGTATAHNGRIRIVKLPAGSVWAESTGEQTLTSSTTFTDVTGAAVSGLPINTDYLILASAEIRCEVANAVGVKLLGTGVTTQQVYSGVSDASNYASVMIASKDAAPTAAKIQFAQHTSSATAARIRNVRILALKTSDFRNIWGTFNGSSSAATTSYVTRSTLTQTAAAGDHLVIGMAAMHSKSASISSYAQLTSGGASVDEYIRESGNATDPWGTPAGQIIRLENYSAGSRTWTIDRKSEAANTTYLDWSGIVVIDLDNGVQATGTASITEAGDTAGATGTLALSGAAGVTEAADTLAAAGFNPGGAISGVASITEDGDATTATGTVALSGVASATEDADTLVAAGVNPAVPIDGVASITEASDTLSASATSYTGSLNTLTLSAYTASENIAAQGTFDSQSVRTGPGDLVGNINGETSGSTLELALTAGGRFYLDQTGPSIRVNAPLNYETKSSHTIRIRETLGSDVRETDLVITVTNWSESGSTPSPGNWLYYHLILDTDFNTHRPGDPNWFQSVTLTNDIDGTGDTVVEMPTGVGIAFNSGGTYQVLANDTVTGATSGATGVVQAINLQSGSWAAGTAAGTLALTSRTGTFSVSENLNVGANTNVATVADASESGLNLNVPVYLYTVAFSDSSHTIDLHVDQDYGSQAAARAQVDKYTDPLGMLPRVLRDNIRHVQCPKPDGGFSAEDLGHFFVIWGDRADVRIIQGKLEEVFFHEGTHASLQKYTSDYGGIGLPLLYSYPSQTLNTDWSDAVAADTGYLTEYGQRRAASGAPGEDFAESSQIAWAVTMYPERFEPVELAAILAHIPNRLAFFQEVFFANDLTVIEDVDTVAAAGTLGAGSLSGTLSATEASDSVSATATIRIAGSASPTEASDTVAAGGAITLAGAASLTEQGDSLSAVGAVGINGAVSATEASDSLSATAAVAIRGVLAVSEQSDTASGAGGLAAAGSLASTEADDSVSAAGTLPLVAAASITEAGDTVAATGSLVPLAGTGSLALAEAPDTVSAAATISIRAAASITEGDDTLSATAAISIGGVASITEGDDIASGAAGAAIVGSLAAQEADDSVAAVGASPIAGILIAQEAGDTVAASGSVSGGASSGELAANDNDDLVTATGSLALVGSAAIAEGSDILTSGGVFVLPRKATVGVRSYLIPSRRPAQTSTARPRQISTGRR